MSEQPGENGREVPDLEAILREAQGLTPDISAGIRGLAAIHAEWRQSWLDTGKFSEQESFELIRVLVATAAGGIRSLGLS